MSLLYASRNGTNGTPSMKSNSTHPVMDKAKEWQMELLMEKLRSKAGQYKTFSESAKMLRMALLEKRYPVDGVERIQLQKCLDTLQNSIRVTTLSGMVERLESVSRQLGLKFMTSGGGGLEWFISSDMFYVEVVLEPSGDVKDVKIHHEGKQERQSCEELVSCLQQQDFTDFAAQLEGLASIYQLNAEKAVKCNALNALQSLEADLLTLSSLQIMDAQSMLCKSPVGILLKRRGGHAMRLTYWLSPYDLLDQKTMSEVVMTVEQVNKRSLGYSVTVCMEASTAHKLQISPLVTSQRGSNGNNIPIYNTLQAQNSATLPACFALHLHEPLPLCVALAQRIQLVTDMECGDLSTPHPLLSLISQHASRGSLDCANNNGLYVNLPDQTHCYRMTETKGLEAVMVTSVPFTHPKQVPHILSLLRQQAVFNSLISSCIRINSRHDFDTLLLEVTALSWQHLSISLEHPQEESMTTVELDLTDPANVRCNLFGAGASSSQSVTPEFVAKVVQRCMSIPVTMRSLIKRWQNETSLTNGLSNGNGNFNLPLGSGGGGGNGGGGGGHHDDSSRHGMSDYNNMRDPHIKMEPHDSSSNDMGDSASGFPSFNSPLLGDLSGASSMSSFSASTSMMSQSKEPVVINLMSEAVPKKKQRKRKVMDNLWRSPKHKGDDCEIIVESSSNESTPHGTPTSRDAPADFRIPTPTSIEYPHLMEEGKPEPTSADKGQSELEGMLGEDVVEIQEMDSVEEMLKAVNARKIKKPRDERKSPSSIMLDIEGKSMVPPSVSITPINTSSSSSLSSSLNSVLSGMGLERRPGIEIIPIGTTPPASLPSTITITPIPPSKTLSDDRARERKSRDKGRSEEEEKRLEKKRKRKREDSPMGPPEKLPPKQDPLSKPVSVSIKPTDSPPMSMSRPSSPAGTLRKYSTSPTHTSPLVLMSKSASSPGGMSKSSKPSPTQQSPKHSPAYSTSSPKHNPIPSSASPKQHGTSSPKHTSGSSGKPSMSTLKSAASSPSGKSSSGDPMKLKPQSSSKDGSGNRDKERSRMSSSLPTSVGSGSGGGTSSSSSSSGGGGGSGGSSSVSSSGHQSPKLKSSNIKVKQPDFSLGSDTTVTPIPPPPPPTVSGSSTSPSTSQESKQSSSTALPQIRNRKNSLSAVIDKLKSQHTTGDDLALTVSSGGISASISGSSSGSSSGMGSNDPGCSSGNGSRDRIPTPTKSTDMKNVSGPVKPGDSGKNPGEYMVKPGSEGIKLTINKTRTKESSSKSSSSSSSSGAPSSSGMIKSSSQSGSGSPKIHSGHTGLKPGVNSGPASKKPQTSSSSSSPSLPKIPSSGSSSSGSSTSSSGIKTTSNPSSKTPSSIPSSSSSSSSSANIPKSSSSSSSSSTSKSISKSSGSPKLGSSSSSDPNRNRDGSKPRPPKSSSSSSGSDKSLFGNNKESRKSSPAPLRDEESERTFKAITSKMDASFAFEGIVKTLDTKFQIPKLSARSNNPDSDQSKKTTPEKSETGSSSRSIEANKALDLVKPEAKYSTSSPIPSTSPSLPSTCSSGITVVPTPSKVDDKPSISQIESKVSKAPSSSVTQSHSSPSPRLTPSPLPKLESKTPTDGSPIPGLTITPIGSIASLGGGGGSSSNDSMDLSIDLSSRPSSEAKCKSESQRGPISILPSSSKDDLGISKSFGSSSPAESPVPKVDKPRDFSMGGEDSKKLALETALARMEESRSTPPSGPSSQEAAEMLLDFSSVGKSTPAEPSVKKMTVTERVMAAMPSRRNTTPPPPMFPASPSVTMHIVKSPSSLIIPSPQSGSPCITDDDLMDEALVGMGK